MADEQTQTPPSIVDGGIPTDEESRLAAQVDTIGENPQEEPAAEVASPAAAMVDTAAAPAPDEPPAAAAAEPAAATPAPAPAPAPVVAEVVAPPPQPPRDFDADIAENQRKFDEGEIEGEEYQKTLRALTKEEAQFTARLEIWSERQASAAQQADREFAEVSLKWEKDNAEFMSNPLRRQQMQLAINAVAQETPGLSPADLFDQAAKIAFEAYGFQPKAAVLVVDQAKALADAVAKRTPAGVPPTLASSPAASAIEAPPGTSAFASLDAKDISSLEDAVARMTPEQRDAYLRDAPGSNSTGIPG